MKNIYADMNVEIIANMSLRKSKTLDFLKSLESFPGKKRNLKEVRKKISKQIPYDEELSETVIELRRERL